MRLLYGGLGSRVGRRNGDHVRGRRKDFKGSRISPTPCLPTSVFGVATSCVYAKGRRYGGRRGRHRGLHLRIYVCLVGSHCFFSQLYQRRCKRSRVSNF